MCKYIYLTIIRDYNKSYNKDLLVLPQAMVTPD